MLAATHPAVPPPTIATLAIRLPAGTAVPDATKAIYDALNSVHERVQQHGPAAAASNWRG
jgi:hypothetical protein